MAWRLPPMVEKARGDMGHAAAFMLLASVVTGRRFLIANDSMQRNI